MRRCSGRMLAALLSTLLAATTASAGLAAGPSAAELSAASRAPVPSATVTGPLGDEGVKGHPFNALPFDPRSIGYVEQEFLLSGTATAYKSSPVLLAQPGVEATPPPAPYETRLLVRRPADPRRFNGTVVVEWLNVTSGYDVEAAWADLRRGLVRDGYAYVGVTAQLVGVTGLKAYDPVRYATLHLAGDQYSYDVFSQAVKAVRQPAGVRPLGPLTGRRVIATGTSQSGSALNNYVNTVAPQVERVIDGYLPMTSATPLDGPDEPVLRVLTEWEAADAAGQADGPRFVQWQIGGATHTDTHQGDYFAQTHDRDFGMPSGVSWPLTPRDIPNCRIGSFPKYLAANAALSALNRWVVRGTRPPAAPPITMQDGAVVRDELGNAVGGLRLPAADVPTFASYGEQANECAFTLGKTVPFDAATLKRLYPTHADYVAKVQDAASRSVEAGWLLPVDARAVVAAAKAAPIPG